MAETETPPEEEQAPPEEQPSGPVEGPAAPEGGPEPPEDFERPEIEDRSFALGYEIAEPLEVEYQVVTAGVGGVTVTTETIETPAMPIRPEQTPKKRTGLEEADSDRGRGDEIAPKDYDNNIVRGEVEDPLAEKTTATTKES